jgi:DNA-binding NarL/FixJ family response regulator
MKRLPPDPPPGLVAFEIEPGRVLFVQPLAHEIEDDRLSAAERAVATLVLRGWSNAEIASHRGTTKRTAANQVASIFRKLGIASRAELAAAFSAPS